MRILATGMTPASTVKNSQSFGKITNNRTEKAVKSDIARQRDYMQSAYKEGQRRVAESDVLELTKTGTDEWGKPKYRLDLNLGKVTLAEGNISMLYHPFDRPSGLRNIMSKVDDIKKTMEELSTPEVWCS